MGDLEAEPGRAGEVFQADVEAGGGALVFLEDAADLPVHLGRVERCLGALDAAGQARQRRFDAGAELVVHRPLLAPPIGRAAQDDGLARLGAAGELDLDILADLPPAIAGRERSGKALQLGLRRTDDVAPPGRPQPGQVLGAGHAAIADPHPPDHAVPGLHRRHDRLKRPRIMGVAGEHLVAERKAVEGHDQRDADLLAIGPVIA